MGKPAAPDPPDPYETAAAQTQQNFYTTLMNQSLGTTDQETPYGTLDYTQTGYDTIVGPDGKVYKVPKYKATVALSNAAQSAVGNNINAANNMAALASQQSARLGSILGSQPAISGAATTRKAAEEALMSRLNPQLDRDRESLRTTLANQGIREGSVAYDRAMGRFGEQANDARMQAIINSGAEQSRDIQNQLAVRSAPINEITAAMSGGQVNMPQFTNAPGVTMENVPTGEYIQNAYEGELQSWQTQVQSQTQLMGGVLGLFGSILSDIRLKDDIVRIGGNGPLGVYRFRYIWEEPGTRHVGYMAQEVAQVAPEAVVERDGFLAVNYGMLPVIGVGQEIVQ